VHVAAGNLTLLGIVGVDAAPDLYGKLEGEVVPRMLGMIKKNDSLEKTITDKQAVIALLRRSLDAVREHLHKHRILDWSGRMFSLESVLPFAEFTCEDYATCTSTWGSSSDIREPWAWPLHGPIGANPAARSSNRDGRFLTRR